MNYKKTIASLLALCIAGSAYSFKVNYDGVSGKPIHEQITLDALLGISVVLADGRIAIFSEETIKGIQEENTENDEKGLEYGFMHFDDSRINESSSYVWNATNAAISGFINSANGLGIKTYGDWGVLDGLSVITNLGTAAHTTQDFFAHSTWVETNIELKAYVDNDLDTGGFIQTNRYKYIPVPLLGIEEKLFQSGEFARHAKGVSVFDDEGGKTGATASVTGGCRPKVVIGSTAESPKYHASILQISSAYYDYQMSEMPGGFQSSLDTIGTSTSDWNTLASSYLIGTYRKESETPINWPIDFCTHGDNLAGINKDHEKRDGHLKAYDSAMQATRALALHFLDKSGATSSTYISRACNSNLGSLLKCVGTGTGSLDAYKISSIKAMTPNVAAEDFKPSFKFTIDKVLANQGLLHVTFDGEACYIYDDDSNSTTKTFFCDSDKKGAGKLRIAQKALTALPLYESDTFAIRCENGLSSVDGGCGNIVSDTVAPFFVEIGKSISFWLNSTLQGIKTVVWNFGEVVGEKTVAFSSLLGISDAVTATFNTVGTKTITATFKDALDTVLGTATTTVTVTAAPAPTTTATISTATSDSANQPGTIVNGASTDDATPTISGIISAPLTNGQNVNVYDGATQYTATNVSGNNWSFTPTTPLIGGVHNFTADVSDFQGIPGPRSEAYSIHVLSTSSTNLLLGATATDSCAASCPSNVYGSPTSGIVDGLTSTGRNLGTYSGTFNVFVANPISLARLWISPFMSPNGMVSFEVQTSTDPAGAAGTWTSHGGIQSSKWNSGTFFSVMLNPNTTGVRVVKLIVYSSPAWVALSELQGFESASQDYNAANDFSPVINPNGAWSYGWALSLGQPFQLFTTHVPPIQMPAAITNRLWSLGSIGEPMIVHNNTNAQQDFSTARVAPGALIMHPGPKGEVAITRWVAPVAGLYAVSAKFGGADIHPQGGENVFILKSGVTIFHDTVDFLDPALLKPKVWTGSLALAAGETLDFVVGDGGNGYEFDSTRVEVSVVPIQ